MSLKIRLSRGGAKKRPMYRIVVADSRSARDGRFIERLGLYQPMLPGDHPERLTMDTDRVKYWLGQGAKPTDRVAVFLGNAEIIPMPERTKGSGKQAVREAEAAAAAEAEAEPAAEAEAEPAAEAEAEPAAEEVAEGGEGDGEEKAS